MNNDKISYAVYYTLDLSIEGSESPNAFKTVVNLDNIDMRLAKLLQNLLISNPNTMFMGLAFQYELNQMEEKQNKLNEQTGRMKIAIEFKQK